MMTLFEVKQALATVGEQLQKNETEITQKAIDPNIAMKELQQLEVTKQSLQKRFDILKNQHDQLEQEQKANLAKGQFTQSEDPQQKLIDAKASLIRSTMKKDSISKEASEVLEQQYGGNVFQSLIDDAATGGQNFIPKNTGTEVISEPVVANKLRGISAMTNIPNLELPKISFSLDDDDFIEDGETAKELKAN